MHESNAKARISPRATLEILGIPGASVAVFPETPLDAPPPPIFEGALPATGHIRLRVPRASLLIVVSGFGKASVQFSEGVTFQSVDGRPAGYRAEDT